MLKFFADSSARRSDYSYCHSSQRRKAKEANLARILQCFKMKTKTFDRISSKYQNKVIFSKTSPNLSTCNAQTSLTFFDKQQLGNS